MEYAALPEGAEGARGSLSWMNRENSWDNAINTQSVEYWQSIHVLCDKRKHRRIETHQLLATLENVNAASHRDLIRLLPDLTKEQRIAAIGIFDLLRVRLAGPALFQCWLTKDKDERFAAKNALQTVGSVRANKLLINTVRTNPDPNRAEEACYILSFSYSSGPALVPHFLAMATDKQLPPDVRAQACEGLANDHYSDARTKRFKTVLNWLLPLLKDESVEVRFWASFALGNMRAKAAIPHLQRVVDEDDGFCRGWWFVRDEAADSILSILKKPRPDRTQMLEPPGV